MNIEPAVLFSALAHDTRLHCLLLLLEFEELCVCELTHAVGAAQPHMSRHLGQLREAGLVWSTDGPGAPTVDLAPFKHLDELRLQAEIDGIGRIQLVDSDAPATRP